MKKLIIGFAAGVFLATSAFADIRMKNWEDPDAPVWKESEYKLPAFPKDADLIEFYVSAVSKNKHFIDTNSISTSDADGVVRYTMVVKTAGGATNISYEGLRCKDLNMRIYATGRSDGTWSPSRVSDWKPVRNLTMNQQQGALARNYFCPNSIHIFTADEGRNALRLGKHPSAP